MAIATLPNLACGTGMQQPLHADKQIENQEFQYTLGLEAQRKWAAASIVHRVTVLQRARHELASMAPRLADAISGLHRTPADTMVAEVLPLLAAIRFLELHAGEILKPKRLGAKGRPFWLSGVRSTIQRVPFGTILVIAPANYPLLLAGVQACQALVAGNAVVWKPGRGGSAVARVLLEVFERCGLPHGLLRVTEETVEAAQAALHAGVDKVIFTGSAAAGRAILRTLAESLTPAVVELSGCDAVLVLPGADVHRVSKALAFGMRLNGSSTCMAPRRVLLLDPDPTRRFAFIQSLRGELDQVPGIRLSPSTCEQLKGLLAQAQAAGATVVGEVSEASTRPVLVMRGSPQMDLASADVFAPVLMILEVREEEVERVLDASPLALGVSIFGPEKDALQMSQRVTAGTVLVNDLIVPTADPRLPFGGRRGSGFGVTRGSEGLLEMTAVKVVAIRRGKSTRHYDPTGSAHAGLFEGVISASHEGTWQQRWQGLRRMIVAVSRLSRNKGD